jgi:hypothetical protein
MANALVIGPKGPHLWPERRMQIGYNPGPKEVPLARRRDGAGLGGWIGGPAGAAGQNGGGWGGVT